MLCICTLFIFRDINMAVETSVCCRESMCECFYRNRDGLLLARQQACWSHFLSFPWCDERMKGALHFFLQERENRKWEGFQVPVFTLSTFTGEKEAGFDFNSSCYDVTFSIQSETFLEIIIFTDQLFNFINFILILFLNWIN